MPPYRLAPRRNTPDLVSEASGDARHVAPYYPAGLTAQVLGPHSVRAISISRLYLLRQPKVAVDFEPSPLDDVPLMHCEVKRAWCHAHGIVYVPIFLRERLTLDVFGLRLQTEQEALAAAKSAAAFDKAMAPSSPEIGDAEFHRLVDQETMVRMKVDMSLRKLRGAAHLHRLRAVRTTVENDFRKRLLNGDLGSYVSYLQSPIPAR